MEEGYPSRQPAASEMSAAEPVSERRVNSCALYTGRTTGRGPSDQPADGTRAAGREANGHSPRRIAQMANTTRPHTSVVAPMAMKNVPVATYTNSQPTSATMHGNG